MDILRNRLCLPLLAFVLLALIGPGRASAQIVINEFLATGGEGLLDEDGDGSDWIELLNLGEQTVDLDGWGLTDRPLELKWFFPAGVTMAPGDFLVVFASGKDRAALGAELHTSFQLSGDGEYLALVRPDGETVEHAYTPAYPRQRSDISYGLTQAVQTVTLVGEGRERHVPRAHRGRPRRTLGPAGF